MDIREPIEAYAIDYPASDGEPLAETDLHIQLMFDLRSMLQYFFRDQPDVYIATNLFVYYEEGKAGKRVAPDVFFVRGVEKRKRRIFKIWEEGRGPDLVIELSSRQTWREDINTKRPLYAQLGVREYFLFDPEYDYLIDSLLAYRLENGKYEPMEIKNGRVMSEVLGLELVDTGETLRVFDPISDNFLLTPEEQAEAHRREAEAHRRETEARKLETAAREKAEAEVAKLREELARLRQVNHVEE